MTPQAAAALVGAGADALDASGHHGLADALRAVLAGETWDDALGVAPGWQLVVLHRRRQEALRLILAALPPEQSERAYATAVAGLLQAFVRRGHVGEDQPGVLGPLAAYMVAGGPGSVSSLRKAIRELPPPLPTTHIFWDLSIPEPDWPNVTLAASHSAEAYAGDGPVIHPIRETRGADRSVRCPTA